MLNFLDKYKLIKGQSAIGVELIYNAKDSYTLIAIELNANKAGIEISRRFTDITFEELVKENTKNLPLYISIGGKGIIHKKVKTNEHTKEQELLNQVLPNASLKDFYIQQSIISIHECWVSIIRKEVLDVLLQKIKSLNLFSIQLYLGPFILENVIPLLSAVSLITTTHELIVENDHIIQLDSLGAVASGDEYNIEGEIVNSHELIAFSSGLSHFIPSTKLIGINCEELEHTKQEFLHKNKFLVVGFSLLVFFFTVTIINMLVGNSLQTTNNELQYQINSKKQYVDELRILNEELIIKEGFIQNSGVTKASKISFYADQIALSVPNTIQLNQLFINPLSKKISKAEDINFNYHVIKISGTVDRSIELNNWIKYLQGYEWTNEVNIISFIQDNLSTPGEFEISILINH
jgi:hypothetical protein